MPWGASLGHQVTGRRAGDLEQVPSAELTYALLRSDGGRGASATPGNRELSGRPLAGGRRGAGRWAAGPAVLGHTAPSARGFGATWRRSGAGATVAGATVAAAARPGKEGLAGRRTAQGPEGKPHLSVVAV